MNCFIAVIFLMVTHVDQTWKSVIKGLYAFDDRLEQLGIDQEINDAAYI